MHVVPMPKFIGLIMLYSITSFLVFGFVYRALGMKTHFNCGDADTTNASHAFYHSWSVQATCMDEITPKTQTGRIVQATQAAMAWLPMIILLAPWNIIRDS